MIYAVRRLIEADFTVSAINTQITALNTLYSLTVPSIVSVFDGAQKNVADLQDAAFPMVVHYVGTQPTNGEWAALGRRDFPDFPLILAYHTRVQSLASARQHSEVTLEALFPIVEALRGKSFGSTLRGILNVEQPVASVEEFLGKDGAPIRLGGVLRTSLYTRTQGV